MAVEPTVVVVPAILAVTLIVTGTSAAYVVRQKTMEYRQVRTLLVMVHVFYLGVVAVEAVRNFVSSDPFLAFYTISNTTFVLADVLLLTLIAIAIYLRPKGGSTLDILKELVKHQSQVTFFIIYVAYIVIAEGYLLVGYFMGINPFIPQVIPNVVGIEVTATRFDPLYLDMLLGILLIFIAYPSTLFLLARRRTADTQVRRAFTILPLTWVGIGVDLLIFNGYLLNQGIDASAIGYLFAALAFAATAAIFRRATLLSAFFQPAAIQAPPVAPVTTFSGRLGLDTQRIIKKQFLLEVDPAVKYEESLRDLVLELGANQYLVFAFTSRGSPIFHAVSGLENVRLFTMTTKVSYPKQGDEPNEVMVPGNDQSVLLNVLDKAFESNPDIKFAVIFDSITDMMLSSGLEKTYKFLKQTKEIINDRVTAVFLLTSGAHSEREVNVVKSLYDNQLSFRAGKLAVMKAG